MILSQYSLQDIATEITNQLFTKFKEENNTSSQKLLNSEEVAKHFGISKLTLFNWRKTGVINFTKIGQKVLYRTEDIQALIKPSK